MSSSTGRRPTRRRPSRRRGGRGRLNRGLGALAVVVLVIGGLVLGVRYLWRNAQLGSSANGCTLAAWDLSVDQAQVAATMVSVVLNRELPERASVLVLAAALQESKLTDIPAGDGDRDSVGVLQQRPSQGWGTATQISDVHYATGKFLDAMLAVPNWRTGNLADVIQKVQISADGTAYAKHEAEAQTLADAFTGVTAAGIVCTFDKPTTVATSDAVAKVVKADLPIATPITTARTVSVPGAGWATAAWFVAQANRFGIDTVAYRGQRWQRSKGWTADPGALATTVTATLAAVD